MTTKIMTIEITNPISYNMCEHDHNLKKGEVIWHPQVQRRFNKTV